MRRRGDSSQTPVLRSRRRLLLALAQLALAQLPGCRGHAEYLVTFGCTSVATLEVGRTIMGAPSVAASPELASQFFVVRQENAAHLGTSGFGGGTQPVTSGSAYLAGETLHVTFLAGVGGEFAFEVDGIEGGFPAAEMDGGRPKCGGRRIANQAMVDVVMPGHRDGHCGSTPLPDVTFRGAFATAHGAVSILPAVTLHGSCDGTPEPEPEPPTICGTTEAPHSIAIPTGQPGASYTGCVCVNGWYSHAGHGHDCALVHRCDTASQFQSIPPTPTSNAQCAPLTTCRPDEVMIAAPTLTTDRHCEGVWEQVAAETMGDPTCWNVPTGFVFSRCCNMDKSPQGDGTCWSGDFTFERCCRTITFGGGSVDVPPPPITPLPSRPPPPVVATPPAPPIRRPPPPPGVNGLNPPPPPGSGSADCYGVWGTCTYACQKRYTVITTARADGEPCPTADLTLAPCQHGDGKCLQAIPTAT